MDFATKKKRGRPPKKNVSSGEVLSARAHEVRQVERRSVERNTSLDSVLQVRCTPTDGAIQEWLDIADKSLLTIERVASLPTLSSGRLKGRNGVSSLRAVYVAI